MAAPPEASGFEPRVLVSCQLCGRLLVLPPTDSATCPDCRDHRARLLEGKATARRRNPTRWERFGWADRRERREASARA